MTQPRVWSRPAIALCGLWMCLGGFEAAAQSPVPPCTADTQIGAVTYSSSQTITAPNYISATGAVTAGSGVNVRFQAGTSICFGTGFDFSAASGGTLDAAIAALPALSITGPSSLPNGMQGQTYPSIIMTAAGGTGNYAWSATGLPGGLSISTGGVITGVPAGSSSLFNVTVTVTDTESNVSISQNYTSAILYASPQSLNLTAGGATGSIIALTAPPTIAWTATSTGTSWLTIGSGSSGTGGGTITLIAAPNTGTTTRTAAIAISVGLVQLGSIPVQETGALVSVSQTSYNAPQAGGSSGIVVTVPQGAQWTASSSDSWLTVTNGGPNTNTGAFTLTAMPNNGTSTRNATVTVTSGGAAATVAVSQPGIVFTESPASFSGIVIGGTGTITVSASVTAGAWTATSSTGWLTPTSTGGSGTSSSFTFTVGTPGSLPSTAYYTITSNGGGSIAVVYVTATSGGAGGGAAISPLTKEYIRAGSQLIAIEITPVETVSTPSTPSGPGSGQPGISYTFIASGSTDSTGASVQYQFSRGDGTSPSGWLATGTTSASHIWSGAGTYSVTAQARSVSNTSILSNMSAALPVVIGETVSQPNTPTGPAAGVAGNSYSFSTGGSTDSAGNAVQYIFYWSDGTNSGWLPTGTTSASHAWQNTGSFTVTAQARSAVNTAVVSATSPGLSATMNNAPPVPVSLGATQSDGSYEYFTSVVQDYAGATDLQEIDYLFTPTPANGSYCHVAYFNTGYVYLDSPAANDKWTGNGQLQTNNFLSNGFCAVKLQNSYVSNNGTTKTLVIDVVFTTYGAYTMQLYANNPAGQSGWTTFGTWNVQPFANYYVCNVSGDCNPGSSLTFGTGDSFTINLYTNLPQTAFTECWNNNLGCQANYGTTDSGGNWTISGTFPSGDDGAWQEYVQLPSSSPVVTSDTSYFTVSN